ncbi:LLM class flavin-dependent oxidoreductase [Nocardiopsis sp. CNT-189]|uniref:LLM class flavin-dependent oxidoreductase n=1 Tax=Nocardiopsis oceanisediminis TaxID=2816862 RepID=UPI003B354BDA
MTLLSIYLPVSPERAERFTPYAALAARHGAARLWAAQSFSFDSHLGIAHAARSGHPVPAGTGVALMPLSHPMEAAMRARSTAVATGKPFIAGFGPGSPEFQRLLAGRAYRSPLTAVREYLAITRGLVRGEAVDLDGTYFSMHGALPPAPHPPVEVAVGVLRQGMAEVAGESADAAITWLVPPDHLRGALRPAIEQGAARSGRPVPRTVCAVSAAVAAPGADPVRLARIAHQGHFQGAHYRAMLAEAGVPVDPADPDASAAALVDSGLFLWGSPEEISEGVRHYFEAGADEVALYFGATAAVRSEAETLSDIAAVLSVADTDRFLHPSDAQSEESRTT